MDAPDLSLVDPEALGHLSRGPEMIRLLVAHGDHLSRAGLEALLDDEPDITVAGSAGDGEEAIAEAREVRPDVLLVDIAMPGIDAVEATRQIVAAPGLSGIGVVMLGDSERDDEVLAALRAGATGFLTRDTEPEALLDALRAVAAGEAALFPSVVRRMISELASSPDPGLPGPEQLGELTRREREGQDAGLPGWVEELRREARARHLHLLLLGAGPATGWDAGNARGALTGTTGQRSSNQRKATP